MNWKKILSETALGALRAGTWALEAEIRREPEPAPPPPPEPPPAGEPEPLATGPGPLDAGARLAEEIALIDRAHSAALTTLDEEPTTSEARSLTRMISPNRVIIAFHSLKGGIGTTTLAAHLCALAQDLGIRVAGVSADFKKELPRFLEPEGIPCIELDPRRDEPDFDIFVIDVQSTTAPPIEPDVWIIPICHGASSESAAAVLADRLRAPMIWLGNKGHQVRDVPGYLQHEIEVGEAIPFSRAVEVAGADYRVVWSVPELALTPGAQDLRRALKKLLTCAVALVRSVPPPAPGVEAGAGQGVAL